ncbi:hypothetical protein [Streptomyces sp. NPDC051567]|uniref:hypothetical protein n=1 Tax=Streptomyces sp. NPDC051567 TaxID=3365660 RepID=UPI00379AECD8
MWNLLGPSDEEILHLAAMGEEVRRGWLFTHQPANPDDRFYWWDTLMEVSLARVRSSAPLTPTQREYSLLAAQATKEAIELQVIPPWKGYMRLAFLVSEYGRHPGSDVQEVLHPDKVAANTLRLIGKPYEEIVEAAESWPSRPIDEIAELRMVKNIVHVLGVIAPHVLDPGLRKAISRWLDACEKLP